MSQPNPPKPTPDDLLADFTDRVLEGEVSAPASPAENELRGLEETVLHLKRTLVQATPNEQMLRRMQADFKTRARKADPSGSSFWQFLRPRQRLVLSLATVALAVILIALPFLTVTNPPVEGTAGVQTQGIILLVGVVCVVALLIWSRRHK